MSETARIAQLLAALLVLAGSGAAPAWAAPGRKSKPDPEAEALAELRHEWARLNRDVPGVHVDGERRLSLVGQALALGTEEALRWVASQARDPRQADVRVAIEQALVEAAPDSRVVLEFFRGRLEANEGDRTFARDYLVARALRERDAEWLQTWFEGAPLADRFLALEALGSLRAPATLPCAWTLATDRGWQPSSEGPVSCATIIAALSPFEGEPAARLMMLLRVDPRFGPRDEAEIEEATRRWAHRDLGAYVDLASLARGGPRERAENARFCGRVGLERARLPLVSLLRDGSEPAEVRAAAAEALGGLRIARVALARELEARTGADSPEVVRLGAIRGLARLGIRDAAATLVELADGPDGDAVRAALAEATGLPQDADWRAWLETARASLPEGA